MASNVRAIKLNLSRAAQLFNSFDPAPFHERDLDAEAEEYIVGSAEEAGKNEPLEIEIHLPSAEVGADSALADAIHNYFAYRNIQERRQLRLLLRDGRISLAIGLTFLFACVLARQLALSFGRGTVSQIIGESALIVGWVAMWRPLEIFLYEWLPILRRAMVLGRLAKTPVIVKADRSSLAS